MESRTGVFRELHATVIPVPDLERAHAFYGGVLGLAVVREIPGALTVYGTAGPTHICLFLPLEAGEGPTSGGAFANFRSDDIEVTRQHLLDHGVDCGGIDDTPVLKWFSFRDPFGNRIDVCEYDEEWLP